MDIDTPLTRCERRGASPTVGSWVAASNCAGSKWRGQGAL